jgi:hypothetical protein
MNIMLPPTGPSEAERWVAGGRRAAAHDLIDRLTGVRSAGEIFLLAGDSIDRDVLVETGAIPLEAPPGAFHFGKTLAGIVSKEGFRELAYFGGASAPLMTESMLQDVFYRIEEDARPTAVVNNYHSTDWMVLNHADVLIQLQHRLSRDNSLGWVLDHDGGFDVQVVPPGAANQVDIDTPSDLLMLHRHPSLGDALKQFLESAPVSCFNDVDRILSVLSTPASSLTLIGRTSPQLWGMLSKQTQIWIRSYAEERGMMASGRFERGEVQSLIGEIVDEWGPQRFVEYIAHLSNGVLWDTRVWMAHRGKWPSTADRFAADLGWLDRVNDEPLRQLARYVHQCDVPILMGGYGVVAGGIYALLESLETTAYQPSRNERQS